MQLSIDVRAHAYDALPVLANVAFEVAQGEVVALIGPSGCGKSTLLGIVGGLIRPSDGVVEVRGAMAPGTLNPFTYVFQDFALLPWRSVADNVAFALEHHQLSRAERAARVDDALRRTGLSDFARALPKQLSGGMRQRVGIARALAVSPAVLLLDEPLSALDAQTREILMEDFLDIWLRDRITALYVTHKLSAALRLAARVVGLSRRPGRIKEIVAIDIPQAERTGTAAAAPLARLHERLWTLIRDEAVSADREMIHA